MIGTLKMAGIPVALIKEQVLPISFCIDYVVQHIYTMFDWNFHITQC